jgi:hypothetical protein
MYNIIGADGKQYGPVSLGQMQQWIKEGRINAKSRVQAAGAADWKTAAEFPELGLGTAGGGPSVGPTAPPLPASQPAAPQSGLAITSLVLGILSLVCFGVLAGIPAIICGHIARARSRRYPAVYGGAGLALAGLIMGYVGVVITLVVLPAMLLPALSQSRSKAQRINCVNNLKQIGLAFRVWAIDNGDQFPFNVSTNKGGTMELSTRNRDGVDNHPEWIFQVMSNELSTPKILVCPADGSKQPALDFRSLQAANVSYRVYSGTNVTDANPQEILAICPIHDNVLLCDGSVQQFSKARLAQYIAERERERSRQ